MLFDVGIPMLAVAWPLFWLTFVPVVLIEAEVAHRQLGLGRKQAIKISAVANALSTLIGIPVVWVGLVLLEMAIGYSLSGVVTIDGWQYALFPFMAAWLFPTEDVRIVFAAFMVLVIPFYIASIYLESRVARRYLAHVDAALVWKWATTANALSYACIVVVAAVYTVLHWPKAA